MYRIAPRKRRPGVNFNDNGDADVQLWAPNASRVAIAINQTQQLDLASIGHGYWQLLTDKIKPGDQYYFLLDDDKKRPDPASMAQYEGVHGPSVAIDTTAYEWTDTNWKNIPLDTYIIYELHTGTFSEEGTFNGLAQKLDHLIDLGITAIEIMPVAQFPGKRNWGYDGVYPYAVQDSYGGAHALQELVNICHEKGLAVILDVVYNHMGPEGNYLNDFGPYFTDKYHTPWGAAINFDDAGCDGVRQFFIENVLMWFRDFHIDALRMDAVHAIKDLSPKHVLQEIKEHVNELMKLTGKTHYLIIECDLNDTRFIDPLNERGYGMDAQWIDEFHHALRVTSGNDRSGYYADFNGIEDLAKAYKDAYVYDGIYSEHRNKIFGTKTNNAGRQFVIFSQNHDQVGNRMLGERTSQLVSFEMQKLMAGAVMVAPYIPLLFMGEEWSEPNPFQYFVSHTDPELAEAVRKGRKAEFAAFHIEGEAPDPMAIETFERSKLQWHLLQQQQHNTMLGYYKKLIALRKAEPSLAKPERNCLEVSCNKETQTLYLKRWHEDQHIICMMNFSKQLQPIALPEQGMRLKLLDSADTQWGGPGSSAAIKDNIVLLNPESIVIYKQ